MKASMPVIYCDSDWCANWTTDYYGQGASAVDGVRVTERRRAPGWISTQNRDLCNKCAEGDQP